MIGVRLVLAGMAAACAPTVGGPAVTIPAVALDRQWQHAGDTAAVGEWSGADGTSSVALPDGRIAWFFSDTFLGPVNPDGSRPADTPVVHNSLVVQHGARLTTVAAATPVTPPPGVAGWYWAAAGTTEDGRLVEFYHRITGSSGWDFVQQDTAIVTFALPELRPESVHDLSIAPPETDPSPIMWGAALLAADGWTYVYGYRTRLDQAGQPKYLCIARVRSGSLSDPAEWRYDTGTSWSSDPARAAQSATRVDTGFSVVRVEGHYALVTRRPTGGLTDGTVIAYLADSPTGPFRASDISVLYRAPEAADGQYIYEAHAHPELSTRGEIVVSYNVNSTSTDAACMPRVLRQAGLYRPRFILVPAVVFHRGHDPPPNPRPTGPGPRWYPACPRRMQAAF